MNRIIILLSFIFLPLTLSKGQYVISGSALVCTSGATFSVNFGTGNSCNESLLNWSYSSNMSLVSKSGNTITVKATGSTSGSTGWIKVVVDGKITATYSVWVGPPSANQDFVIGVIGTYPFDDKVKKGRSITLGPNVGHGSQEKVTKYTWRTGSWASYVTGYSNMYGIPNSHMQILLNGTNIPPSQMITVTAVNGCGSTETGRLFYAVD